MQQLYIDESGSMTKQFSTNNPFFIIAIIRPHDPEKLRKLHKRFVDKHLEELRAADTNGRMFKNGKFVELKGSSFTPKLKKDFISYFCRPNTLDIFYIRIDNREITGKLYANTARAFNYSLQLALKYFITSKYLPDDCYHLQLDERNESTETRHFLQDYLNTELQMSGVLSSDVFVEYFDSAHNKNIQLADVFANILYSHLLTNNYQAEFNKMSSSGCLKFVFKFPLK